MFRASTSPGGVEPSVRPEANIIAIASQQNTKGFNLM
jgi:hypothetical protein